MAQNDLIEIAAFPNVLEAATVQGQLIDAGIDAVLQGAETAAMLTHLGSPVAKVSVLIRADDRERVIELLQHWNEGLAIGPWTCEGCGTTVERGFAVCWNCGLEWTGKTDSEETDEGVGREADGRFDQPAFTDLEGVTSEGDALVERAYRAAIYGSVFPPLVVYAIILILRTCFHPVSGHRRQLAAILLCGLIAVAYAALGGAFVLIRI